MDCVFRIWAGRFKWMLIILGLSLSFLSASWVSAQPVNRDSTVTVGVGDTVLEITGSTSPGAFITFKDGGNLIGTTTANGSGAFSQTFPAQTPGIHSISVTAEDSEGRLTDSVSANVNLVEHFTTTLDLFLPSTIQLSEASLSIGENLIISGETLPGSSVAINLDNNQTASVTSNGSGEWTYSLPTANLAPGQHSIYVVVSNSGDTSYPTAARTFTLSAPPSTTTPPGSTVPPGQTVVRPPAPTITEPADGAIITNDQLTVRGTGLPGAQIELYNGDIIIGSTFVDEDGNWSITVTITNEKYNFRARACVAGVCSEFSTPVRITTDFTVSQAALKVELDRYAFQVLVGDPISFTLTITGGLGPYEVEVIWGDGNTQTFTASSSDTALNHIFNSDGRFNGTVKVRDASGKSAQVSFSTLVIADDRVILYNIIILVALVTWSVLFLVLAAKNLVLFPFRVSKLKAKK